MCKISDQSFTEELTMEPDRFTGGSNLDDALEKVNDVVLDGLKHGFFDYTITCEMVKDRRRRLIIHAGKSHQYTIPEEALAN